MPPDPVPSPPAPRILIGALCAAVAAVPLTGCGEKAPSPAPQLRNAPSNSTDPVLTKVASIISDTLGKPAHTITGEKDLTKDLGADSLDCVEIVMAVEEEFNISIDDAAAEKMQTVGDLVNYVRTHKKP